MDVRLSAFADALEGFSYLVSLDMEELGQTLDERVIDGLQNGKVQKFEYTVELCWKAIKQALRALEGIDEASPKKVIKAWYLAGYLDETDYVGLLAAIDDRSRLSHIYDEDAFNVIIARLPDHADLLERVLISIRDAVGQSDGAR